jgi:hypothetical protein
MGIRIEDLPLRLQAQVRAQLAGYSEPAAVPTPSTALPRPLAPRGIKEPNKTELDYQRRHLRGLDARYEALTFRMANGHRYTPDWVVFNDGRPVACHECKGGYALHSQQRARLAFDQVRMEFPGLCWVWAVKSADGWQINKLGDDNGMP